MDIDTQLIRQIAQQQHHALAQLYERHVMHMFAVATRILKSRKDAEDLIHDVFLEIWNKAADFDASRSSARTWILMRVRSRAVDRLRQLARTQKIFSADAYDESGAVQTTEPAPDQLAEWQYARSAVEQLPESQYTVIVLSYYEGLTCSEIAERCQIPVGTVKSRLSAAIRHLRGALESSGEKTHARPR
ncbi:RNA polymerase sigma factor [Nitrosomonas sp. Nm51]|uniref:RNA polymerase sigma factor n=1 Tax=Nitrosomonas sp. Nm51 TaxID=133720 RepID=UPI000B825FAF|nr:sigma-70 family RNA polymerase sigma factor [Nitrosomonas sp. Nm51]